MPIEDVTPYLELNSPSDRYRAFSIGAGDTSETVGVDAQVCGGWVSPLRRVESVHQVCSYGEAHSFPQLNSLAERQVHTQAGRSFNPARAQSTRLARFWIAKEDIS